MPSELISEVAPSGNLAMHDVSFSGLAGGIFWSLLVSFILFLVGFSTDAWQRYIQASEGTTIWVGLWKNCMCDNVHIHESFAWFKASQAMFTLALLCMLTALVLTLLYMFVPRVKKSVILVVFTTLCFVSFFFMLVGVSVFGVKTSQMEFGGGHQGYSFILTVVSAVFTLGSGLLAVFQMRTSGMF